MSSFSLREHQMVLLSMLKEIERICCKYNIKYMLFGGTSLGAVRHKGFIPWDDDLDIVMLRSEYEKFMEIAPSELDSKHYFLQKEFSEHWPCFFSKLRKNNTAYMEKTIPKDNKQHQGIYIDIFPCDNLSNSSWMARLQFYASKVVIAKCLWKRGYKTKSFLKKIFMSFCCCFPITPFLKIVQNPKANDTKKVHSFFGGSSKYNKSIYPREWFLEICKLRFEDGEFPVSKHYDELLSTLYGDYMTLPSEEERKCKVHAMKIDLEHSYEKYIDWQAKQKIDVYTRSIR